MTDLNDTMTALRPVTPPVACSVPAVTLVPLRTVGWGHSVAMWIRANAIDPDGLLPAVLLDEGTTAQGLHVARVAATLRSARGERLWDVIAVVPWAKVTGLPDGYEPLM